MVYTRLPHAFEKIIFIFKKNHMRETKTKLYFILAVTKYIFLKVCCSYFFILLFLSSSDKMYQMKLIQAPTPLSSHRSNQPKTRHRSNQHMEVLFTPSPTVLRCKVPS